jgi:hypothetical protein
MIGLQRSDENKIKCKDCKYAMKGKILFGKCEKYPEGKPDDVYFEFADCPEYKQGEDLLKYEIQL